MIAATIQRTIGIITKVDKSIATQLHEQLVYILSWYGRREE